MIINADNFLQGTPFKTHTKYVVIEKNCLNDFDEILRQNGVEGDVAGIFDTNTVCAKGMVHTALSQKIVLEAENLHANEEAVRQTLSQLKTNVKVIASFGSGTLTDVARYCAKVKNLVFVCCPTAASVDGFCSSVCAMTFNGVKVTLPAVAPTVVIADLNVIEQAPERLVKSGLGDVLGKYVSLADWKIAHLICGEDYCKQTAQLTADALNAVTQLAANGGFKAKDFYLTVTYALLLSGLAMQSVNSSRPASGAEHHFSHLLGIAPPELGLHSDALHGETVGVGTLCITDFYRTVIRSEGVLNQICGGLHALRNSASGRLRNDVFYSDNFGGIAQPLIEENKAECLLSVDEKALRRNWDAVLNVIDCLPSRNDLSALFSAFSMKSSLSDLGVAENKKNLAISLSPYVRNRVTFNRLLRLANGI